MRIGHPSRKLVERMKKGLGLEMYLMSWCHFVTFSLREGQTLHIKDIAELSSATQPFQILHADLCGPFHYSVRHVNYFVGMVTDRN